MRRNGRLWAMTSVVAWALAVCGSATAQEARPDLMMESAMDATEASGASCDAACDRCSLTPTREAWLTARERVPLALSEMDVATPTKLIRFRYDASYEWDRPDRAEFLWARLAANGGRGPGLLETNVDYQDVRVYYEAGEGPISFFTDLGLRSIDPEVNPDTTGFADMNVGIKSRIIEKDRWEVSSIFRTYIPSGNTRKGLGVGHVSLEPGILANYQLRETTYLHGELKIWIPIGGNQDFQGEVLRYGLGVSHLLYENQCRKFAVIPTFETIFWNVLDGMETTPAGLSVGIDDTFIVNIQPGVRMLFGDHFDCGISGGWGITDDTWYQGLARLDLRWYF